MTKGTEVGQDQYCYPGTTTLINKFNIQNSDSLANAEYHLVRKAALTLPQSPPNEAGFKDNHLFLYGQLYSWAGQNRFCALTTHGVQHSAPKDIQPNLTKQFETIALAKCFSGLKPAEFADAAAPAIGNLAVIGPFRAGNDVALRYFIKHLAAQAGHGFDVRAIDPQAWVTAKQQSALENFRPMAETIRASIAAAPSIGLRIDNAPTPKRNRGRDDPFTR